MLTYCLSRICCVMSGVEFVSARDKKCMSRSASACGEGASDSE